MAKDIKKDLKKLAKEGEIKLTESILKWKYKKEGKQIPHEDILKHSSRAITDKANEILYQKGKTIFNEIKKAYHERKKRNSNQDSGS